MRRARLKVTPNLGVSSRLSKANEQLLNVVESKPPYVISSAKDESNIHENSVEDSPQPPDPPASPDKENVELLCSREVDCCSSRDAPHQVRTSSSVSESEDDVGKQQARTPLTPIRKSPVRKDVTLETSSPALPKEISKKRKIKERTPLEMKKAAMRKKFSNGQIERSELTMFDLIYYNPRDGERPLKAKGKLKMRPRPYEIEVLLEKDPVKDSSENTLLEEMLAEEQEINKMEENQNNGPDMNEKKGTLDVSNKETREDTDNEQEEEESMPVPQVRLGPDGEIMIDDQSLVIDTSQTKKSKRQLASAPIVVENSSTLVNYGSWRKRRRSARWSLKETARFYRVLSMLGTNFSLMENFFQKRPRVELKRKFKTEEKINPQLVDKIISQQIPFDPSQFMDLDD